MKKLLIFIFTFFIGCISFSSAFQDCACYSCAWETWFDSEISSAILDVHWITIFNWVYGWYYKLNDCDNWDVINEYGMYFFDSSDVVLFCPYTPLDCANWEGYCWYSFVTDISCLSSSSWSSSSSEINVYYNNWSSTSIVCDWENSITINWLSTLYWTSTFIPFFNISYVDENNQKLIESYDKEILYLSWWQYHKTYTWWSNNDWILNLVTSEDTLFTWYLPTFDVTWNITEIDTWNVFNNFAENSLTVLLSNIPNYIQYVIMFALLLFVLWIFRRLRK